MNYLFNIEKSGFRRFEYVGYGGGAVWKIRKNGCGTDLLPKLAHVRSALITA